MTYSTSQNKSRMTAMILFQAIVVFWFTIPILFAAELASGFKEAPSPIRITLKGPASLPQSEISGLAPYKDAFILLTQYPKRFGDKKQGKLFGISKQRILDYISGKNTAPVAPYEISFISGGIENEIDGFEGYEALTFDENRVYLTIETKPSRFSSRMQGYMVSGEISEDGKAIALLPKTLTTIPVSTKISNMAEESVFLYKDMICAVNEANGVSVNKAPKASCFTKELDFAESLPFPHVEYRITDTTDPDEFNRFFAVNFLFSADRAKLSPSLKRLTKIYGKGIARKLELSASFLLEFVINKDGIALSDSPPLLIPKDPHDSPRNWEGIAKLDDAGALIVTDTYPQTLLAFVPFP